MTVVLAFFNGDSKQALDLLQFMQQLGGCKNHKCLLVVDVTTDWAVCLDALKIAQSCFQSAEIITNERPTQGWPAGANSLFFAAAKHLKGQPFFWLEADCTILKASWLDEIESAYSTCGKPFLGHIYECQTPGLAPRYMSGVAAYPSNAIDLIKPGGGAWDMATAMLENGADVGLVRHFWGEKNLAPIFVETKTQQSPVNAFTLADIPDKAVIWHRTKDSSLLNLIRKKLFPPKPAQLLCVIPVWGGDAEAVLRNVQWMAEINSSSKNYPALLSVDGQTYRQKVHEIESVVRQAFGEVKVHFYNSTSQPWPRGANHAFQQAARFVEQHYTIPWLWCESDMVALKPSWMEDLSEAYHRSGKDFFGPVVSQRGHINGCSIYPWNTATCLPSAMNATNFAWDYACKEEMLPRACNAEPLINHAWGAVNNQPHPFDGNPIRFSTVDDVKRFIHPDAVVFHRSKFGDLQRILKQMHNAT